MTLPAVIVVSEGSASTAVVGGLTVVNRHILLLYGLGVRNFYLVGATRGIRIDRFDRIPEDAVLHGVPCPDAHLAAGVRSLPVEAEDILLIRGDCVIDPRLPAALLEKEQPHWLRLPTGETEALPAAARLSPELRRIWANAGRAAWLRNSPELIPDALDAYSPSHRGRVPFYVLKISSRETADAATRHLIRHAQKTVLDLPARLLDPLFENILVFRLCRTRITPNQITLFTAVLGVFIAGLFLNGFLRIGSLLAYAVEVLDGVDGKLARTKLQFSRLGEMEHILDFFMEQAWYLCITLFLYSSTGSRWVLAIGLGLMACDLTDSLLYYLIHVRLGRELDELTKFDRGFRLIAGRRNIYLWMFIFGFWTGYPVQSLAAAFFWALVTIGIHGFRVADHVRRRNVTGSMKQVDSPAGGSAEH